MVAWSPEYVERLVADAVERLRREFNPEAIYFFGSVAEGRGGPHSDLDFLVVVGESTENKLERIGRGLRALAGMPVAKDVIVSTRAEFDRNAVSGWTVEGQARKHGRLVYGR